MEYIRLGQTSLKVSRLCMGMMTYGDPKWRPWVLPAADARRGVKRGVAGLVAELERRVVRLQLGQYARDLLRRLPIAQQSCAVAPQRVSLGQTRWVSCRSRQPSGALLRKRCAIATGQQWTAALPGVRCRVGPAVAF